MKMILVEIKFGNSRQRERSELEDTAETYIASLFHFGHLCGEYFLTWIKGQLICHTMMAGLGAEKLRFHSEGSRANLKRVVDTFGGNPVWTIRDDDMPARNVSWRSPSLHLFTHALDWKPPVCRGDTGEPVASFLLPVDFQIKNDLVRWQQEYILYDRLWLNSDSLELPAYKELVDPRSSLSLEGRRLCTEVQKATRVPTFYYLARFYASDEMDDRPCPGCGKNWRTPQPDGAPFHQWAFCCKSCRLVSSVGVDVNRRLARIGQRKTSLSKKSILSRSRDVKSEIRR
jgi:predicted  nucleic acid-binding Zn ribbon protein